MNGHRTERLTAGRDVGVLGVGAAAFGLSSLLLFGLLLGFDPAAGAALVERVGELQPNDAALLRWAALTDLLGYYLLPGAIFVLVRGRIPWISEAQRDIGTWAGVAYAVAGGAGAAMLASAAPPLIGSGAALEAVTSSVGGIWQLLNPILFGTWAAAMALAFRARGERLAAAFGLLAVGAVLVWVGRALSVDVLTIAGLGLWLVPFPFVIATAGRWSR